MLQSLLPKAHRKSLALPLLGPIADGFDDWLTANGYTPGSRKFAIRMLPHVDADLRRRHAGAVSSLTHSMLHASWRDLIKRFPTNAGTVRTLERYLTASGVIAADDGETTGRSTAAILSEEYVHPLRDVCGLAASRLSHHRRASRSFLDYLEAKQIPVASVHPSDVEGYVSQTGKRLSRAACNTRLPPCAVCCGSSQQTAGSRRDSMVRSTRPGSTGLSNCPGPCRGRP